MSNNKVKLILTIVGIVAVIAVLGLVFGGKPDVNPNSDDAASVSQTVTPSPSVKAAVKKVSMTENQKQALGKAEEYLAFTAFSHDGLVNQMVLFDHFSRADAKWGVDHLTDVNWDEQAAKKAQQYLEMQHFSRAGLIAQLKYDKFSPAQAEAATEKAFNSAD